MRNRKNEGRKKDKRGEETLNIIFIGPCFMILLFASGSLQFFLFVPHILS
jgi:hypothetical protein